MLFFVVYGLLLINIVTFAAFGLDKNKAEHGKWRISELFLFVLSAIGGSVGALMAIDLFRHKSQKPRFTIGIPLILILQLLGIAFLLWTRVKVW